MTTGPLDPEAYRREMGAWAPRLFLVGAPRAGTTTVYNLLARHPDVYMTPRKEPGFFHLYGQREPWRGPGDRQGVGRLDGYARLFVGAAGQAVIGEASTVYLYSDVAAERIARCAPDARILAILRHPVDRAYSNYMQHVMQGREHVMDFAEAVRRQGARLGAGWAPFWDYTGMGMYGRQLRRYFDAFPRPSVLVLRYEDVVAGTEPVMDRISTFLGVRRVPLAPVPGGLNASGVPRSRAVNAVLQQVRRGVLHLPDAIRFRAEAAMEVLIRRNLRSVRLRGPLRDRLSEVFLRDCEEAGRLVGEDLARVWFAGGRHR